MLIGSFRIPNDHFPFGFVHFQVGLQMILIMDKRKRKTIMLDRQSMTMIREMDFELHVHWYENATGIVNRDFWMFGHRLVRRMSNDTRTIPFNAKEDVRKALMAPGLMVVKTSPSTGGFLSRLPFYVFIHDFRKTI
jgi:hypothetical protein